MKTMLVVGMILVAVVLWSTFALLAAPAQEGLQSLRDTALKLEREGNFREAYDLFRKLALDPGNDARKVGEDLNHALQCLQRLNLIHEIDAFREGVIEVHAENWRLLWAAAETYLNIPHHGFLIAGEFHRGRHRGGGRVVNAAERDRVRALQLMKQALPLAQEDENHGEVGHYLLAFARMLLNNRGYSESWRLQYLTDLGELPDYDDGWGHGGGTSGAPVDEEGNPVLHSTPKTFGDAQTDGQRRRWCLEQAVEFNVGLKLEVLMERANFLHNQFGVQTMGHYGWFFGRNQVDDTREDESGTYALHTLGENETIARLATGIKRFELPDEFNFVKLYQQVAAETKGGHGTTAMTQLAAIFENRRQYPKAADHWQKLLDEYQGSSSQRDGWKQRLAQITDNWGRFEPIMTQPKGKGATVEYRFRNGNRVSFTAHEILVEKLLDDVQAYLKSRPDRIDHRKINIGNLGYRLVHENQQQYVGKEVAKWDLDLDPREAHFDKRVTVTTPLQKAGAYLLKAQMAGGNTSCIIVWLSDLALVKKPLCLDKDAPQQSSNQATYYYVADSVSGQAASKAKLDFFGFRVQYHSKPRRHEVITKQFAEFADADGQLVTTSERQPNNFQWIVAARTDEGKFGYLGFTNVWYGRYHDAEYHATKVYAITDRPVYRPSHKVHYKLWVRHAKYDRDDTSDFAGQAFTLEINNPKGEKVVEKEVQADEFGGVEGDLELADDAMLGVWRFGLRGADMPQAAGRGGDPKLLEAIKLSLKRGVAARPQRRLGGGTFRVEEYKKPEFEVTVEAPDEPVMLGEKITAKIEAKYYFGAPVTHAKVKYKVTRSSHDERWYPVAPWDWLYGRGYWWFAYDYDWYPGWGEWGCPAPIPFWWPQRHTPPEVVAEQEVEIGEDGTVKVVIDTGVAKAIHPDQDHRYSITAEVVDQSRRTIVGTGEVLVARKPFKVYAWVDRGYYRSGDIIRAHFHAHTLDNKPVEGKGKVLLNRISYQDGEPVETTLGSRPLPTNVEGRAEIPMRATRPGQYRLVYELTDAAGHTIEGAYIFTVIGEGFDGADFRYDDLELVPDKQDYKPGEKVKLQINTNRTGGTVLLFVRPANGVYLKPRVVRLEGKSTVEEIEVARRDMPNFFIEAVTIANGEVHVQSKDLAIPPEKRVLSVDIEPSKEAYRPGEKAEVKMTLKDFFGKPFVGSTVVAIYDKSLEYISGGTNVGDIKEFFWKWRRHHNPRTEENLTRHFRNLYPKGATGMSNLGVFGETVATEMEEVLRTKGGMVAKRRQGGRGGGGGMAFGAAPMAMADGAMEEAGAAMPAAAPMDAKMKIANGLAAASPKPGGAPAAGGDAAMVQPTVRTKFADTALWVGALTTDGDGTATVKLDMPENLTTWRIKVWGMGHGTKVGEGATDVVTRKDLILRMQAPRFFVQKDEVVLSANVHNYLDTKKEVRVELQLDGEVLGPMEDPLVQTVQIAPNDEARVDWRVEVLDEGEAVVLMKALTDEESDAMEMKFPSYVHGMLKMEARSGVIRPEDESGKMTFTVPAERRPKQTRLEVRYSPTLAGAMVDALPYLVEYPYGCTEQTLNRFLPTVMTQKILLDMGLNLEDIKKKRANLNAQELGDAPERAAQWKRYDRNPVFDEDQVRAMVKDGVERLTEMQLSDGGWGWFSGWGEHSYPHTTALVVHGLQLAKENDVAIPAGVIERGIAWLKQQQETEVRKLKNALKDPKKKPWKSQCSPTDAFVYMVLVEAEVNNADMLEFLYRDRLKLPVYCMAMYGIALEKLSHEKKDDTGQKLDMILRNINQYVEQDDENQTAWLNLPGGYWWCWYGSEYEAQAYYLKLLARTDAKGPLASRMVKYLLNNRKHATYWNSTRDTAICIEAMAEYMRASGEDKPEMTVEVWLDGALQQAVEITPATLFQFDDRFVREGAEVEAGPHEIELKKKGKGPLYFNGYLTNFTLEDFITKAGLEVKVQRRYFRLDPVDKTIKAAGSRGQVVDQKVEKYERVAIPNLATLKSGQLCEIELVIESKNDYEYLVFEDMKPAGFETVNVRSGYTGNEMGAYVEFRDNRVVFFVHRLARGKHSVSYRMRAEIPGKFSALPTRAWAMYAPELKANSDEIKLKVED